MSHGIHQVWQRVNPQLNTGLQKDPAVYKRHAFSIKTETENKMMKKMYTSNSNHKKFNILD